MNSSSRSHVALKPIVNRQILLFVLLACSFGTALAHMGIDPSEFQARRQSVMNAASDGIVLLHSFSGPKSWSESGFRHDSNFFYWTGLENPYLLWAAAIKAKWPDANIADATPILHKIRAVKSAAEIALMKKAAEFTDAGFRAAMAAIVPGRTNREIEGAAIAAAFRAGADGLSWPELRSGPVSSRTVFQKFYDYHLLNRTLQAGETAPMDLGFSSEFYKGDVGRTLPVSGHFTPDQREVIDFMNNAYHSGPKAMHDGVSGDEIIPTCLRHLDNHEDRLQSDP